MIEIRRLTAWDLALPASYGLFVYGLWPNPPWDLLLALMLTAVGIAWNVARRRSQNPPLEVLPRELRVQARQYRYRDLREFAVVHDGTENARGFAVVATFRSGAGVRVAANLLQDQAAYLRARLEGARTSAATGKRERRSAE